jgi:hypothetical protein
MENETTGEEYERGNNRNASDPAIGEFDGAEMTVAGRPAHRPVSRFHRRFVPARVIPTDLDRLYRSLSTRLGNNFKGK